nr:feruloyl CoA ortho-hydroxylase 1 [Tanacetum cinerariifolium]
MKEEYDALVKNETWSLVPRASNTNVVYGKWVYMLKRDKNGVITCYKARFVAKGFRQQPRIDFHGTFSPVVKSTTIRAVLSLAVTNNWPLRQLDVHNAFLHGNIKEQASRAWFERLSKALFDLGFKGSKTYPSMFIYSHGHTLLYTLVYVDDIIVTGNNKGAIDNIICQLGSAFSLKDLGPLNYFLGIEIVPHVSGILLSQKKYILELLQSAGLSSCNPVSSSMVTSSSLSLDDNTAFFSPTKYRQVVGSLQYVTISRPDIAFAVDKLNMMLIRRSSGSTLQAFTDVLWKGNLDTSLEAFSGIQMIDEAEYKALADTVAELIWLQALLYELGIRSSSTLILWCDNLGATYLSANPIFRARTKHVEIDYHFVREKKVVCFGAENAFQFLCLMRLPRGGIESSQFSAMLEATRDIMLSDKEDDWKWAFNPTGFSVASARKYIDEHILIGGFTTTRWLKCVPIKVNIFMWRLSLDKLGTLENMDRKGSDVASLLCPVCCEYVENVNHLFSCGMSRDLWTSLASWCDLNIPVIANLSEWMSWLDACQVTKKARIILEGIVASMLWSIWKFRNDLIFSVSKPKKATIWDFIGTKDTQANTKTKAQFSSQMAPSFTDENSLFNFVVKDGNGVKGLVDSGLTHVPGQYIQPPNHRINKQNATVSPENMTIDLSGLDGPNHDQVVKSISYAAETLGFFQFFNQTSEKKAVYLKGVSPSPMVKYGTSFVPEKEKALEWKDYISMIYTNDADALEFWPNECKEVVLEYIKTSTEMVKRLLHALMDNLGDMGTLTVLLQDGIGGLYVKQGEDSSSGNEDWIEIPPVHGALVINIGDALQIISNGRYKSAEHRVRTTSVESRVSVPIFNAPLPMVKIGPLPEVVARDGVARYRELVFEEYMNNFFGKSHDGKKSLDFAAI